MLFGFLDAKTIYVIFHLIGTVIGMGGALLSDAMFFATIKDRVITPVELGFLKLGGRAVWLGLAIIFISGLLLFSTDPARYMDSSKFLVKVTIVAVIALNGVLLHKKHMPCMEKSAGMQLKDSPHFQKDAGLMLASGAISVVSWFSALILGSIRSIPYTYIQGMLFYILVVCGAILFALLSRKRILGF